MGKKLEKDAKEGLHLKAFIEAATDAVYLFDSELKLVDANKLALKMLHKSKMDAIGKNVLELSPKLKETGRYDIYKEVIRTGKPFISDITPPKEFGSINLHMRAFKVGNGLGVMVSDITERKKEELRLFKGLIEQSNDAIFVINPEEGKLLDVNKKACSDLKYTKKELLNMKVTDIEAVLPDNFSWNKHVEKVKKKGFVIMEGKHKRKDGTIFPVEVNVKFIKVQNKEYMVGIVRDITERKKAQEDMKYRHGESERFNQFSVDRELRMIELKKEINSLLHKKGKKPKYKANHSGAQK